MDDPAEKYRDNVDPEHKMAMEAIGVTRMVLSPHRKAFERLLQAERNAHSIGHITDPTLYRDMIHSESFAQQIALVRAALEFLDKVDAVASELETQ